MSDDELHLSASEEARIDTILRSLSEADFDLDEPPSTLWGEIEASVRADEATQLEHDLSLPVSADSSSSADNVIDLSARFRKSAVYFAAAAAAVVAVAAGTVLFATSDDNSTEVVGEALLDWQDGFVAEGVDIDVQASIVADGDNQSVRIEEAELPIRAEEDLELWLIGVDGAGELTIQTLGVIDDAAQPGTFAVPDEFDSEAFETVLVDISYEPRDGVETHSGASIVRGEITNA